MRRMILTIVAAVYVVSMGAITPSQSGGGFTIERSTIAGGGNASGGGAFTLLSAMGEAAGGMTATGGGLGAAPGFWSVESTGYSIVGAVVRPGGGGITNATATLSGGPIVIPRTIRTTRRGSFNFDNVMPGYTYTVSVTARRFAFTQPTQTVSVESTLSAMVFTSTF